METPLERIMNVGFSRRGLLQTLFAYGSVEVQVAGLPTPMVLKNVANPEKLKDLLWQNHTKTMQNKANSQEVIVPSRKIIN